MKILICLLAASLLVLGATKTKEIAYVFDTTKIPDVLISFRTTGNTVIEVLPNGDVIYDTNNLKAASAQFWEAVSLATKQQIKTLKETRDMLKECANYIQPSTSVHVELSVYRSPSQQLREQADAIDAKDAMAAKLKTFIEELEKDPRLSGQK